MPLSIPMSTGVSLAWMTTRPPSSTSMYKLCLSSSSIPTSGVLPVASALICLGWPSPKNRNVVNVEVNLSIVGEKRLAHVCERQSQLGHQRIRQGQEAAVAGVHHGLDVPG